MSAGVQTAGCSMVHAAGCWLLLWWSEACLLEGWLQAIPLLGTALCRIKLLPVTHVLVDTWMLTVKLVYKLSDEPDDLKWATNTHMTPFTLTFKA